MANVGFLRGPQANIDSLLKNKSATPGTFYLTSDTNRLYIGKDDKSIAPVNAGIITVTNINALPAASESIMGSFYYAQTENILCILNGNSGQWVQINPVVTNSYVNITASKDTANEVVTVTTGIKDSSGQLVQQGIKLKGSKGIAFDVATAAINSETGAVTTPAEITIKGPEIDFAVDDNTDLATLAIGEEEIYLETDGRLQLEEITGEGLGVKIKGDYLNSLSVTPTGTGFTIGGKYQSGQNITTSATLTPKIKLNENSSAINFNNGVATLGTYSSSEIDNKIANTLKDFNAVEYKGTVGSDDATNGENLPTTQVKNGYAYLLDTDKTIDGINRAAGTLVIATGTEDSDGYITGDITWSYVTGNNSDTTYYGEEIDHGLQIRSSQGPIVAKISFESNDGSLTIGSENKDKDDKTALIQLGHNTDYLSGSITAEGLQEDGYITPEETGSITQSAKSSIDIPVIDKVYFDKGHITGYSIKTYTVQDTHVKLHAVNTTIGVEGSVATITNKVALNSNGQTTGNDYAKTSTFAIESNSLAITESEEKENTIAINLVWGTF